MSVATIVEEALRAAKLTAGGGVKTASAGEGSLLDEAEKVANALEFAAGAIVDDGTPEGRLHSSVIRDFFKRAGADHPPESAAPTGTQAVPPQAGARKILPTGQASGSHPPESAAPTGTQATLDQQTKKAERPTILDVIMKRADSAAPVQSEALQDAEDPGKRNENSNVDRILGSNAGPVNATKRDAKLPTRARLKALFASASDTGPSSAAAQSAFPTAYSRGGMKVADGEVAVVPAADPAAVDPLAEERRRVTLLGTAGPVAGLAASPGRRLSTAAGATIGNGIGAVGGGLTGALAGGALGAAGGYAHGGAEGALSGALIGGLTGGLGGEFVGGLGGGALGARIGHHYQHDGVSPVAKQASLTDYSALFVKAASGELGPEAKAFADYIESLEV